MMDRTRGFRWAAALFFAVVGACGDADVGADADTAPTDGALVDAAGAVHDTAAPGDSADPDTGFRALTPCTVAAALAAEATAAAVDCGVGDNPDKLRDAYACAAGAFIAGKPFVARFVVTGVDSKDEHGLLGDGAGDVARFHAELSPLKCRPKCKVSVRRTRCVGPYVEVHAGVASIWCASLGPPERLCAPPGTSVDNGADVLWQVRYRVDGGKWPPAHKSSGPCDALPCGPG